jgi:hypothetical protein
VKSEAFIVKSESFLGGGKLAQNGRFHSRATRLELIIHFIETGVALLVNGSNANAGRRGFASRHSIKHHQYSKFGGSTGKRLDPIIRRMPPCSRN